MMFKRTREASADGSKDVSGDDSQSSSILCTRKRRRLANASQLDLCQEIFDALRSYRSEDGSLCETFMRLPSKRSNAEYYEAVKELMDLARVQAKIKSSEYESIDDMAADINLIVANTKAFYPASTTEFAKAVELQEVFDKERYRVQALVAASSASTASSASSKTAHNRIRRRRRPKREEPDDDEVESASIAASEDSHIAPSETSTTNLTTSSQRSSGAFESPYEMLFAAIAKFIDEDGRSLAHTFTYLPSREEYPVYYAVIEEPIDLRMIARRIQSGRYSSLDELEKDFMLMSRNAKTFNEPKSLIYQDATTLARILKGKRSEAEHPPLRTNKERGKRASRLNYDPHEVVMHYATLTEGPSAYQLIKQNESEADLGSSVAGEEDDTRATGNTSQSCSSVSSSPGKRKRGRPPKHHPQPTMTTSQDGSRESIPVESSSPLITAAVGTPPTSAPADVRQSFGDASSVGSNSVSGNSSSVSRYRVGTVRWRVSQVLQAVLDARNESGHLLCTPFMRLPSRKIYPDYYQEIANPMSLADIKKKLKLNSYTSLNSLMNDLDLVFKNAQQYNVEESAIYRDSLVLQQIMRQRYQEMLAYDAFSSKRIHSPALSTAIVTTASTPDPSIGSFTHHDATPQKRPGKRLMTAEEAKTKRLHNLFNTVINYVAEDGHRPHEVFMHLPSKVDYPEYYKVIPEPIDLTIIRRKMEQNEYRAHQEMVADLRLMFNNARHFNEEGSQVYNDADMLDRAVKRRLKSLGPYQARTDRNSGTPETHPQQVVGTTGDMYRTPANVVAPPNASPSGMQTHLQSSPAIPLLQRVILELFQTVREYQVNGRQLSACFMRLPTRSEMPAYYEFIKKPMELQTIAKQVVQMRYTDFEEFVSDLSLMFDNACRFNEPNSQIYTDALTLHRVSLAKRAMILNTFAGHLGIPPCIPPDFPTGVRRLLTNLHNAMLTACDADGRGLVDSLIAGDGTEATLTSVTAARLAALHRAVAAGAYRRLDRLQSDWLKILKRARIGEGADQPSNARNPLPTLQQRLDAADLARRWVRLRDDLCRRQQRRPSTFPLVSSPQGTNVSDSGGALPTHLALLSPAMVYTSAALDRELSEEEAEHKLLLHTDQHGEGIPPPLGSDETVLAEITVRDQSFHVGDFVYVESLHPPGALHRIARILSIRQFTPPAHTSTTPTVYEGDTEKPEAESPPSADTSSHQVIHVHVAWYWRPSEAHPSRRRRLLTSEVFRTALTEVISTGRLVGRCLVMHISQFIRLRAKNMDERDVFICESQFSIKSQTFVKIQNWEIPVPSYVELEQRPMTFVPTRLPPNEPLENALEQVDASLFTDMIYPLPRVYTSIVADDPSESDDIVIHEQYVHQNGFLVKLGDFLYVPTGAALSDKLIVRVDKLWKSNAQDMVYFSGPSFVSPSMVEHLPTRMFFPKEVFLASTEHATYALVSATGKCFVMRPADYCQARPTEFNEHDVYLCDSKYFEDEKVIRKLKKGLKRFQLSAEAYEDEFFFFLQPICPRKEASPLLDQASPEPLSQEQLNRPASSAITCVVAASAGNSTPQHVFPTSSPATTPHLPTDTVVTSRLMTSPSGPAVGGSDSTFGRNATPMTTVKPNELTDESKLMEHTSDRSKKRRKLRKPPSGYVIYAGEVRKRLLQERRDAPFGEISREVGLLWRQMPASQRDFYERKAKLIKRKMEEEEMRAKAREQELARAQLQQQLAAAPSTVMPTNDRHPSPMVQPFSTVPTLMGAPTSAQPHIVSSSTMSQSLTTPHHSIGTPAPSPTMQFYQTPSGQVIQIVHAPQSTVAGSASSAPGQQAVSSGSGTFSQAAAFTTLPAMSTSCAVPGGTHQVVYQLPGHHPTSVMPSGSMGSSTPQTAYYQQQHQRLLVASNSGHATQGSVTAVMASGAHMPATIMSGVASTPQAQILLASTGSHAAAMSTHPMATHAMSSTHSSVPVLTAAPNVSLINAVQPLQPGVAHEFSPHHHLHHPQFQIVHPASTAIPGHPAHIASAAQAHVPPSIHGAPGQPQQHGRPPSPIFVSTPPRTSRVLHSEVYQRYITRLRKNIPGGLSDWRNQLSVSADTAPPLPANAISQLGGNFLGNLQNHAHHTNLTEALWSLRDHLLEDALKLKLRCLGSVECA